MFQTRFWALFALVWTAFSAYAQPAFDSLPKQGCDTAYAWARFAPMYDLRSEEPLGIQARNLREIQLTVFNRWGNVLLKEEISLVYDPKQHIDADGNKQRWVDSGWKGEVNGQKVPEGMYPYLLEFKDTRGKTCRRQGMLTIGNFSK